MTTTERTKLINRLQKRHPGTKRQRNYHGAETYTVEFFNRKTGKLIARYNVS